MLGLAAVRKGRAPAQVVAECLREVASRQPADDQMALERCLRRRAPVAARALLGVSAEWLFLPVHCAECGARLRVRTWQLRPAGECPVCDAPLVAPRNATALAEPYEQIRLAAEQPAPYLARPAKRRFAHFDLIGLIRSGGFGKVYEARNLRNGRTVALKLLEFRPLESRSAAFRKLLKEAPFASLLDDPHIVPVFDVGLAEGVPYVEMELMPGGSLDGLVAAGGPLPWRTACGYVLEALSALASSHAVGVIHRDIKPSNILLDSAGHVRLADFGLSKLVHDTTSGTSAGLLAGSPHFMAPEQWTGRPVGPWTDLYSTGLVTYYLLTGIRPFEGDSALSLLYSHLHVELPDPRGVVADVPVMVAQAVRKAAAKDPGDRFRTAEEFASALGEVLGRR